ncbi:hypothetical protein [Pseudomonas gingeri]|uniref:hypothetical protein n=1 Tax=Pseudomonas gingeri TaxID=117681 RepID=UPI0015A0D4AC|nr:hypothetical protein [Pseudomonas gingeri]NWA03711.1 hypothetical protein [Pseudomonas gingeri]NWA14570.1 hypothetical protein [Pseudomonas gingeri]NWA54812.1 hypothetical protein [Pseudomonas gingeri]NWA94536.1 hypothetical protein [Pseudomonas gingeri]NWB01192.1 hypothetical protein [Pseudomonas gingeri]
MYCGIFWHTDVQKLVILDEWGLPFSMPFDASLIPTAATTVQMTSANLAIGTLQTSVGDLSTALASTGATANSALSAANAAQTAASAAQVAASAAASSVSALPPPMKTEVVTATLGAGGTLNAVFAKTYTETPLVIPMTRFVGDQMFAAVVGASSLTGVTVTGKRSRGTLLLTSGPFESAAAGDVVQFAVIGR